MNRCMGCGAILQSSNDNKIGYIPKEKKDTAKLCERCFRLLHYNDLKIVNIDKKEEVLQEINQKGKLVFFLVDLLNINNEVIDTYHNIKAPKCFVLSKIDFIPKYINKEKIRRWLKNIYAIKDDIIFLSAAKNLNIQAIQNIMDKKQVKVSYLVGFTNSGKSTLVNKITDSNNITTSVLPNTTLDFLEINLTENQKIIDSPGFLYNDTLYDKNDFVMIKKINPKTFIKPLTFQLKKNMSILIEDLVRLEVMSEKCNLTIYMSNLLDITQIYISI